MLVLPNLEAFHRSEDISLHISQNLGAHAKGCTVQYLVGQVTPALAGHGFNPKLGHNRIRCKNTQKHSMPSEQGSQIASCPGRTLGYSSFDSRSLPMKTRSLATPDYLGSEPKTFDNRSAQKTALCYHILKSHILVGGIVDQNGIAPESA